MEINFLKADDSSWSLACLLAGKVGFLKKEEPVWTPGYLATPRTRFSMGVDQSGLSWCDSNLLGSGMVRKSDGQVPGFFGKIVDDDFFLIGIRGSNVLQPY